MKILILGRDGYLGWPTALRLSGARHDVAVADDFARRGYDYEMGAGSSVMPTSPPAWWPTSHQRRSSTTPSSRAAPYSMVDRKHAVYTQTNNVVGALNVL
ncbi:MAG: hypothetical protein ACRDOK_12315 [Streptosporangiaceae bacterium]